MIVGNTKITNAPKAAKGSFAEIGGEKFYKIENFDMMQPFFISLASDVDLWMYLSSTGGLTCGRKSPDTALFPYYTDDKITEGAPFTGPRTLVKVLKGEDTYLWEPFSDRQTGMYDVCRSISKSVTGNKLIFEEVNRTLGVSFSYLWTSADHYGWIRRASLGNLNAEPIEMEVLDGLQNVLPAGTNRQTQNVYSTLVDGYKKTEQAGDSPLVLFRMEAIMVDRAEPSESLRCNTVGICGLHPEARILTSNRQLDFFRQGGAVVPEPESKGVRGAIFTWQKVALLSNARKQWYYVADVEKDVCDVKALMHELKEKDAVQKIEEAIAASTATLREIVALNDGIQQTADTHLDARHFANVLFNTMRGGFYVNNYQIGGDAFAAHVRLFNVALADKHQAFLLSLPASIAYAELGRMVREQADPQLERLYLEYLPLTFSRRHGDPSRPWNLFNIRVNDNNGKRLISYQGNWRDIFQNWEALSLSYPGFVDGIIAKFLNATTIDGYNPYKVTSEGIDWEVINPDDPWSNIGYWGDHQIIYLLKLLELSQAHDPKALRSMAGKNIFAFANVPYRLKAYEEIVKDPKNSILFDTDLHATSMRLQSEVGQDAKLILRDGQPLLVSFTEKLLIPFLTKMSNFIPDAGIWMNTLRPEWNDANNALVGFGSSMVTLCYMRRFASFARDFYKDMAADATVSANLKHFLRNELAVMHDHKDALDAGFTPVSRRSFTDGMGLAGEAYRKAVYAQAWSEEEDLSSSEISAFFEEVLRFIDASIRTNKRPDGLYNAYNLVDFSGDSIEVSTLYQMLEGQVAILTSGMLSIEETVELINQMRHSSLYREDQNSYMLYPARRRASFFEKNIIPEEVNAWPETEELLRRGIFTRDMDGILHFNAGFNNVDFLKRAAVGVSADVLEKAVSLYEDVFCHRAFTGRSGTFYKYEGLGCIYWHMVSKLLLAIGENIVRFDEAGVDPQLLEQLKHQYHDVKDGVGAHKSPAAYGSFPFDPYSHTPSMAGVQQPGMTGQVKEDIINRFFELGLRVEEGILRIADTMINPREFADGELRFTYCSVPFVYTLGKEEKGIAVSLADSSLMVLSGNHLTAELSAHLFARDGFITRITVNF